MVASLIFITDEVLFFYSLIWFFCLFVCLINVCNKQVLDHTMQCSVNSKLRLLSNTAALDVRVLKIWRINTYSNDSDAVNGFERRSANQRRAAKFSKLDWSGSFVFNHSTSDSSSGCESIHRIILMRPLEHVTVSITTTSAQDVYQKLHVWFNVNLHIYSPCSDFFSPADGDIWQNIQLWIRIRVLFC